MKRTIQTTILGLLLIGLIGCDSKPTVKKEAPLLPGVKKLAASQNKAISSEAVATMSSINNACRMYHLERSSWPTSLQALISSGQIGKTDLDGTYFKTSDYKITMGEIGNKRQGVLRASVRDRKEGKTYNLAWKPARRAYSVTVK